MKGVQKFVGLDVSKDTISVAVADAGRGEPCEGKLSSAVWRRAVGKVLIKQLVSSLSYTTLRIFQY